MHDDEQSIRERAYFLWQKEGSPDGRSQEFWERAALMEAAQQDAPMTTPLQQRTPDEMEVDEAMKETFPASDAPSYTTSTKTGSKASSKTGKRK